jgi:hypothetical protein
MLQSYDDLRVLPPQAAPLIFDASDQQKAWDQLGANCGPGAIAGLCGETPLKVAKLLGPKLQKLGGSTELMLRQALTELNISWCDATHTWPAYGLVRIQWSGPWIQDPDPFEKHRHSHWIGVATHGLPHVMIFDINAISVGGWISLREWDDVLRPWLLQNSEPEADDTWWISDAVEVSPPKPIELKGTQ